MSSIFASSDTPLFAHQLQALLARQAREDREAVAGSLVRGGFKRQDLGPAVSISKGGGSGGRGRKRSGEVDFSVASPISSRDRQGSGVRLPHFSMSRLNKSIVPQSPSGATHRDYKSTAGAAPGHVNYVKDGAEISHDKHVDYVFRSTAVEDVENFMGTVDVLDTEADRRLQNSLATFSNIPGGRERERSLFRAAERCEREPKINYLTASSADAEYWFRLANREGAPAWVRKASKTLMAERLKVDERAAKSGKTPRHRQVTIAKVSAAEAYDRLTWFDAQPGSGPHKPRFKPGRTGIVQTRFVAELPHGIGPRERGQILQQLCGSLADDGWMLVAAIHQPDPHGDRRNFHIHVDGYERPARWIDLPEGDPNDHDGEGGCWDFEYMVRKRGKETYPLRANKIPEVGRSPDGKRKSEEQFVKVIRRRYVDIVNEVVGGRPDVPVYFAGTYKEAGLNRTPLEHLGNAIIAKEKQGVVTLLGSENARKIYLDALEDCHGRKAKAEADLADMVKSLRAAAGENRQAQALIDYYEILSRNAIERTLQHELVETVERMVKSRAVAVIEHGVDPDVLVAAHAHLREIEGVAPNNGERRTELDRTASLRTEAALIFDEIGSLLPRPTAQAIAQRRPILAPPVNVPERPRRYAELECGRLRQWLAKWAQDPAKLIFSDTGIKLGPDVQHAVHTLFRHYARDSGVQKLLTAERKRRVAAGIPLGIAREERAAAQPLVVADPVRDRQRQEKSPTPQVPPDGVAQAARENDDSTKPASGPVRSMGKGPSRVNDPTDARGRGQGR